jgi:hypothetical protein
VWILMRLKHVALFRVWMFVLFANSPAFGQPAATRRSITSMVASPAVPTITILGTATGALLRSQGASNASVDLGNVSYFKGSSAPGESSQKNASSFVISTRFALKVDCPASSVASRVNVSISRLDAAASHSISIDGTTLRSVAQTLVQSMPCGSSGEHRLDVEVPVSTPAGSIGSTVAFVATLNK